MIVRLRWIALCVALSLGSGAPCAHAQTELENALRQAPPGLEGSHEELDAFFALMGDKNIRARERAEQILAKKPDSYVAHYVLGQVERSAEANFPRAVFHLERALALFGQRHGDPPETPDAPWRWHARILMSLAFAHGDLENHERKLGLLAQYNERYDPDRLAERAWPLMKMRRFDDARVAAREGLATGDGRQKEIALNALCAVEFEAGDNLESYAACKRAMQNARSLGRDLDPADLMNFAEASRSLFKLAEAERVDLEAVEASVAWYGNPWSELSELYTREGRLGEALGALREVPAYRAQRPPHVRNTDRNENRRALASFFVVMGRHEDALRITDKALVAPDRRGHNSRDSMQDRAITALLDRSARLLSASSLRESASTEWFGARMYAWAEAQWLRVQAWSSGRRALRAVGDTERFEGSFQIGTSRAAVMPPWLVGELVQVSEPGVARAAIAAARKLDQRPGAEAYYDAFEGEAALQAGELEDAERLLSQALTALQPAEALLTARVLALLSDVFDERGEGKQRVEYLERTLQVDPGIVRRMQLALPVRVQGSGPLADVLEDGLDASPRFDVGDRGLVVRIQGDRSRGELCLLGSSGDVLGCGRGEAKSNEDVETLAAKVLAEFHARVFAPRVDMSQADANSLDGSTLGGRGQDLDPLLQDGALE